MSITEIFIQRYENEWLQRWNDSQEAVITDGAFFSNDLKVWMNLCPPPRRSTKSE